MTEAPKKKRRKPVLLVTVTSLAAALILYLEFFADPIIDPPQFASDADGLTVQFRTARAPFSRRVLYRLITIHGSFDSGGYDFPGHDVELTHGHARPLPIGGSKCVLLCNWNVRVESSALFDELWRRREEILALGRGRFDTVQTYLTALAQRLGASELLSLANTRRTYGKGD